MAYIPPPNVVQTCLADSVPENEVGRRKRQGFNARGCYDFYEDYDGDDDAMHVGDVTPLGNRGGED